MTFQCPWCEAKQKHDASDMGLKHGETVVNCRECGKEMLVCVEAVPVVTGVWKVKPHKPVSCQHCGHSLDNLVGPGTMMMCSSCPQCRKPYCIEIERIDEVAA